jgi:hypothetical protein
VERSIDDSSRRKAAEAILDEAIQTAENQGSLEQEVILYRAAVRATGIFAGQPARAGEPSVNIEDFALPRRAIVE